MHIKIGTFSGFCVHNNSSIAIFILLSLLFLPPHYTVDGVDNVSSANKPDAAAQRRISRLHSLRLHFARVSSSPVRYGVETVARLRVRFVRERRVTI